MAKGVFFSFNYDNVKDFRVNVVRMSGQFQKNEETHFMDKSIWEKAKTKGEKALCELIDNGLSGSSTLAVLIGSDTFDRKWVRYELLKSFTLGKGILGIHINRIKGKDGFISAKGRSPFEGLRIIVDENGQKIRFEELKDRAWRPFRLLPEANNNVSHTKYFRSGGLFRQSEHGRTFLFSDLFKNYCWVTDNAQQNFKNWIADAN